MWKTPPRTCLALTVTLALLSPMPVEAQSCNQAPLAVDDSAGHLGAPLTIDVLANDQEPNGEPLARDRFGFGRLRAGQCRRGSRACSPDAQSARHSEELHRYLPDPRRAGVVGYRRVDAGREGILFWDGFESGTTSSWSVEQ